MRRQGITKQAWSLCARCGFEFPTSSLSNQKGKFVCDTCVDNTLYERRQRLITDILSDGRESEGRKQDILDTDTDTELEF